MVFNFASAIIHWNIYWLKKPHENSDYPNIFSGSERNRLSYFILCKIRVIGIWPFWNRLLSFTLLDFFFSSIQLFKLWLSQKEQQGANKNRLFKWNWKLILHHYPINTKYAISWKSSVWRFLTLGLEFSF